MVLFQPLNLAMTFRFLTVSLSLMLIMKITSLIIARQPFSRSLFFFFLTPLPSYETWKRAQTPTKLAIRNILTRSLKFLMVSLLYFIVYWSIRDRYDVPWLAIIYLAAPLIWLIGEWASTVFEVIALITSGKLIPPHHNSPPLSLTLTEFWSKRWNNWFYDWFHQVLFKTFKRRPLMAIIITFLVSGIGHEVVISLPFFSLTGINVFGTMTAFFVFQGIGIIIDNRVFKKTQKRLRFIYMWFWLLLFAPLFMSEGTLRLIHAIR